MMNEIKPFSGSYPEQDIQFLLNIVDMAMTPVDEKETLIQSGVKHYSEMLSQEPEPTQAHLDIFNQALHKEGDRLAKEVNLLAHSLHHEFKDEPIVLISLVRAGVPLGVMLQRALKDIGAESYHYGISIIRDRGIDEVALNWIEAKHGTKGIVFVDGWTGKGAITQELQRSLAHRDVYHDNIKLVVLADPCGSAWLTASNDDWLIPFGIMGAPVSGLVSRSIWSDEGLHGCVQCDHLKEYECSQYLVDCVDQHRQKLADIAIEPIVMDHDLQAQLNQQSKDVVAHLAEVYQISNINRIKPGIAEATRAVLRRVPDHVLVQRMDDPDVALLVHLAQSKNVTITEVGDQIGNYRAVTIIKKVS